MPLNTTPSINPTQSRKTRIGNLVLGAVLIVIGFALAAALSPQQQSHYPDVGLRAANALQMDFLHTGLPTKEECAKKVKAVTRTMLGACAECVVVHARCLERLSPRMQLLLNGQALDVPIIRIPNGALIFEGASPELARKTCEESASQSGGVMQCTTPDVVALATALTTISSRTLDFAPPARTLALLTLVSALVSFLVCWLIVVSERWHGRYSLDAVQSGPQKFHTVAVPRIGGLAIVCSIVTVILGLKAAGLMSTAVASGYSLLAVAAIPAFAGGIAEDLTKKVGVLARLLLTMASGVLAALLVGATLDNLDVPGLDHLLQLWPLFAIAFTAFAVGGVANAINIIDGYNGLVGGYSIIVLAALAWVSVQVGDQVVLIASLTMLGAMAGFLVWNWPSGKIFLGDGGAYLLGFWLAELGVLLVVRNPQVSPWFPLAIMAYPIWETIFSMYRRKIMHGHETGQPDAEHFHQILYAWLRRFQEDPNTIIKTAKRNSSVAPPIWAITALFVVPCAAFWNHTPWLITFSALFATGYVWLYFRLMRRPTPPVME